MVWTPQPSKVGQFSEKFKKAEKCTFFTSAKTCLWHTFFQNAIIQIHIKIFQEPTNIFTEEQQFFNMVPGENLYALYHFFSQLHTILLRALRKKGTFLNTWRIHKENY